MSTITLERRPLSELERYANNSKLHPQSQVESIAASITRFGFRDPIAIKGNVIVEGEGRYLAAQHLGMVDVPVIVLPDDLTDEQVRLYRIAHNKIALASTFDFGLLVDQLRDLVLDTASFADMGFSQDAANTLFQMFASEQAPGANEGESAGRVGMDAEVIWDTKTQKDAWSKFTKGVFAASSESTQGEALSALFVGAINGSLKPKREVGQTEGQDVGAMEWLG